MGCGIIQTIPQSVAYNTFVPNVDDSIDLGSLTKRFRDLHLSRDLYIGKIGTTSRLLGVTVDGADSQILQFTTADTFNLTGTRSGVLELQGNEAANTGRVTLFAGATGTARFGTTGSATTEFYTNSLLRWSISAGGTLLQDATNGLDIAFQAATGIIRQNTADAADTKAITITGGGATGSSRGGSIELYGNEFVGVTGKIILRAGNVAGGSIDFATAGTDRWTIVNAGHLTQQATGGDLVFNVAAGVIRQGTADAADTGSITVNGGGANGSSRGASLEVYGNEHANTGQIIVKAGNVAGGSIIFATGGNNRWNIDNAGILQNTTAANESTGAGAALLGGNFPGTTPAAPFTWITLKTSDGSTVYLPVWK